MEKTRYAWLVIAALVSGGCYSYVPADAEIVPVGANIRAHLSREGALQVEELTGRFRRVLDGEVLGLDEQDLVLSARIEPVNASPLARQPMEQPIRVPWESIARVEIRQFDARRTGLFIGGVTATLVGALAYAIRVENPGGSKPPPRNGEL